jgi:drug/metabolite transporter (DMT)-like permease
VLLGLTAAFGAAVAFGVAAVLQAIAARQEPPVRGVDPLLLVRLLRHPAFLAALALNLGGFLLHLVALRSLSLYLAQAVISASVAVTALLSARFLRVRLTRREQLAVLAVCAGLAMLTATASDAGKTVVDGIGPALLAAAAAVAAAGVLVARLRGPLGAALLGVAAGLGFAVVAVAGRVLPELTASALLRSPATYALLAAGGVAFLLYATALQRASVLTATAPMVLANTAAPAAVGVLALGDRVPAGAAPVAALGLVLAVAGSALLARYDPQTLAAELPPAASGVSPPSRR